MCRPVVGPVTHKPRRRAGQREGDDQMVTQGGHSSGKPGKVREMKSGQGNVRENRKNQGKVWENELLQLFSCHNYCSDNNQ